MAPEPRGWPIGSQGFHVATNGSDPGHGGRARLLSFTQPCVCWPLAIRACLHLRRRCPAFSARPACILSSCAGMLPLLGAACMPGPRTRTMRAPFGGSPLSRFTLLWHSLVLSRPDMGTAAVHRCQTQGVRGAAGRERAGRDGPARGGERGEGRSTGGRGNEEGGEAQSGPLRTRATRFGLSGCVARAGGLLLLSR